MSFSPSASASPSQAPGSGLFSREALSDLPINKNNLAIIYGEEDEEDVSTDNQVYVGMSGLNKYLAHQYRFVNDTPHDNLHILINAKSSLAPLLSPVYLQIWNVNNSSWETLTSNNSAGENEEFDLEAEVTSSVTNYYDSSYEVAIRTYQLNNESGIL